MCVCPPRTPPEETPPCVICPRCVVCPRTAGFRHVFVRPAVGNHSLRLWLVCAPPSQGSREGGGGGGLGRRPTPTPAHPETGLCLCRSAVSPPPMTGTPEVPPPGDLRVSFEGRFSPGLAAGAAGAQGGRQRWVPAAAAWGRGRRDVGSRRRRKRAGGLRGERPPGPRPDAGNTGPGPELEGLDGAGR